MNEEHFDDMVETPSSPAGEESAPETPPIAESSEQAVAPDGDAQNGGAGRAQYIVGVGASAGGLEALQELFAAVEPTGLFSYVVVQHLSPDYKSLMPELLSRHTTLEVRHVEDGISLESDVVYLLPPKNNITIFHGKLFLTAQEPTLNLPIDIFFRSLAEDQGDHAVGIILSGTGSDGTRGVRALKEHGGMVLVQDEESAAFDGMPRSAMSTGLVDFVLPPGAMPSKLTQYFSGQQTLSLKLKNLPLSSGNAISKILSLVKIKTGVDFSYYKDSTILRRLERRMSINQVDTPEDYITLLEGHPEEIITLYKEVLIGVTKFFRDSEYFETIKETIAADIFNTKNPGDPVRVWCAGCSTGEEAYSLAIILTEYCEENNLRNDIKIFATDIDRDALEVAAYGMYPVSIAADASMDRLGKFFFKKGDHFQVQPFIRKKVIFAHHNIIKDPPFPRVDLISCRNLLIYLQPVLQRKVLSNFLFSLNEGGYLFLGNSESIGDLSNFFTNVDLKSKIFRYQGGHQRPANVYFSHEPTTTTRPQSQVRGLTQGPVKSAFSESLDLVFDQVMEKCMLPSVLVDSERSVLHVFGDVDDYLRLATGKANLDIQKMARKFISIPLGTALHKAIKDDREVAFPNLPLGPNRPGEGVTLTVSPLSAPNGSAYYVILFEKVQLSADLTEQSISIDETVQSRIQDLERELQYTKENLQATIEELETSNEELQATNEELLASNEELQSTNEELQSVNEELITVNSEYQNKIHELTELNDDINNLMSITNIGTLFLDADLTIRKFTPSISSYFNIIKSDISRPISHLSHNLLMEDFVRRVEIVCNSGQAEEFEVRTTRGECLLLKVVPYETAAAVNAGVVISVVDITRIKNAEDAQVRERDLLKRVFESSPSATTMVSAEGRITFANPAAIQLLGLKRDELGSLTFDAQTFRITDLKGNPIPVEELPFSQVRQTGKSVKYVHAIENGGNKRTVLSITGNPMFDADGNVDGAVFKLEDVTDQY